MVGENISGALLNLSFQNEYSCLKCVIPDAVIPISWRILIILNLVFTALVYVSFVLEKSKTPSAKRIMGFLRKPETFRFFRWIVAFCCFASILVQPFSGVWAGFQVFMIVTTAWLMFKEGATAFNSKKVTK
jgi:hypothetical protein